MTDLERARRNEMVIDGLEEALAPQTACLENRLQRKSASLFVVREQGQKLLFIGDSITDCERSKPDGEGLFNALGRGYVAIVDAFLQSTYPELGIRVVNKGIGGRSYETSKGAVIQFTRATAVDWAPNGVTVNAICPGGFMTEPNVRWSQQNPEIIKTFKSQIPMGDFGQPEDLGPLAVYLASDAARYVTGASFVIDGGYTLW